MILSAVLLWFSATGRAASASSYEGFGASTPGGAGRPDVHVTNLNDSGPGSLREAVSQGNRTVVFDVSGDIVLTGDLYVSGAFITIDGFTAPPPGITLRNRGLIIRGNRGAHDVIVRGIRVRNSPGDGMQIAYGAYNIVIDHVSIHGSGDGNLDITESSHDVTVSWSILAGPTTGKNMLIKYNPARITLHHNLFVWGTTRNPQVRIDDAGTPATDTTVDMRNNLVWNWTGYGTLVLYGPRANVVANYYATSVGDGDDALTVDAGTARAYVAGNVSAENVDLDGASTEAAPFPAPAVNTEDACTAAGLVFAGAGVRPLDATDTGYVLDISLPECAGEPAPPAGEPAPPAGIQLWLEAESGARTAPMTVATDSAASGGQYIHVPNGQGDVTNPALPGGQATYTFSVPAGTYAIWGRVLAATTADDSFSVSLDGSAFTIWDVQGSSSWVWDRVSGRGVADPLLFSLAAGTHTLVIKQREDGTRLDLLLITSDLALVPTQGFGGNQSPVAVNDAASTPSGTAVDVAVLQNDHDPDNGPGPLAIQSVGSPANGTAQRLGTTVRYVPSGGFTGTDTFIYTIADGATTASATVTVTVTGAPVQSPVAVNDAASTPSGTAVDVAVLQNDHDPDNGPGPLAIQSVGSPANGTAQRLGTAVRYVPSGGFTGTDTFIYTISDGAATASATVTVTVTGASVPLWLEAESGARTAPMTVATDSTASGGQYIHVPNGQGDVTNPALPGGQATYTFSVPAGTYAIWGRVLAATTADDSFSVSLDGSAFTIWDVQGSSSWVWDRVSGRGVADPLLFSLAAGTHTLVIKQREDGTRLDRLLITSDLTFVP